ncbi:hypothetical protein [Roseovarius nanhaiticus]|uniref:hypothetical protein n=1 Tax=Roseovarius nanhaiticus TaxID=573024 RepID=UPI0024901301|nr:hypothetical protein [Roseovarius nanhaiticus]
MSDAGEWAPDWDRVLEKGERLLWTGRPEHGRRLWQVVGQEPVWYAGGAIAIAAMWGGVLFIREERADMIILFSALTAIVLLAALFMVLQRQFVLSHLYYAITDRRAIICRRGRDVLLRDGLYFLFFAHDTDWTYPILPGRSLASVRVGTLLSENAVQPFGAGLVHSGWPVLRGRTVTPALFENLPDARAVQRMLREAAARRAGQG